MKQVKGLKLKIEPVQHLDIPFNSEILKFEAKSGEPVLYVMMDESAQKLKRTFRIFADGKDIPLNFNRHNYIGSFDHKAEVGQNTLHVFEE